MPQPAGALAREPPPSAARRSACGAGSDRGLCAQLDSAEALRGLVSELVCARGADHGGTWRFPNAHVLDLPHALLSLLLNLSESPVQSLSLLLDEAQQLVALLVQATAWVEARCASGAPEAGIIAS